MKAMRAMKAAMRAMRAMKAKKRVSKVARGKMSKAVVFRGNKEKTVSGLKKTDLIKSKSGKIVSKKASANGKRAYKRIQGWTKAVQQARKQLKVKGFVAEKKERRTGPRSSCSRAWGFCALSSGGARPSVD